jgi:hypothetical protein
MFLGGFMSVDVKLVKECRELYSKAESLLKEIGDNVEEFCRSNGIELMGDVDSFEPLWKSEYSDYLMVYYAYRRVGGKQQLGYVVIDKNGKIMWTKKAFKWENK